MLPWRCDHQAAAIVECSPELGDVGVKIDCRIGMIRMGADEDQRM